MIDEGTLIIAEAGVNHNGDIELAKKMIEVAKECGADIVKFQTGKADLVTSKFAQMANYQKRNTGIEKTQKELLKNLELPYESFIELANYCSKLDIKFLSTPFEIESIHFLNELGCDLWKIPSGEITNLPYLIEIAKTGKDIILSTGMSTLEEIHTAYNALKKYGAGKITLLHCTTQYPTPYRDVNLNAMLTLRNVFHTDVGYSDHTDGIEVPVAAVALGAKVIEKHFTLDKNMDGPDHKASIEPKQFLSMVNSIRNIEISLGDGEKKPMNSEIENMGIARKSIVAKRHIKKGEIFSEDNITTKRPGNGISPMRWFDVIGQAAIRDFEEDELVEL